jgi:serpin B
VLLGDGRVLVVGNDNICTPGGAWDDSVQAELYDPVAGTWAPTGSLNAPRTDFAAVALPDGRALLTGGLTSAEPAEGVFGAYSSAKLYDAASGTWSPTGLMGTARTEPAVALLPDGTVLVAGGAYVDDQGVRALRSAEIFDPETDAWSRTGDMQVARRGAQAVTLADGRVLVVGGSSTGRRLYFDYTLVPSAEIYDPSTGTWSPAGGLEAPREGFILVPLPDGGALVAGGAVDGGDIQQVTATAERLDPATLRWSPAAAMRTAAANRSAVVLGDGRVLVAGGVTITDARAEGGGTERPPLADAELYDPATGTWTATTPLPEAREGGSFVTLRDRTVLLVGGDEGYVGEPSAPWCPAPVAEAVRYVPGNLASFPVVVTPPDATLAKSDVPRAAGKPADAKKAATSITAFGIDLYRRLLADRELSLAKKNVVFSPTSIALALGMARAGAEGETAAQMDDVLRVSGWTALGREFNALEQALASRNAIWKDGEEKQREVALRIANGTFAQRDWSLVERFLDRTAATFGAGMRLVDYEADPEAARALINAWVKRRTGGRIPELLQPPDVTRDIRLYLVNAVYLKAEWEEWFDRAEPRPFTRLDGSRVSVPTMEAWRGSSPMAPYVRGTGWQATELRFQSPDRETPLAMVLVRPDDLATLERTLTPRTLTGITAALDEERARWDRPLKCPAGWSLGGCYPYDLRLLMPKFSIETRAALNEVLEAAGMPLAFDSERADFTGIHVPESAIDRLYISKVIHQANIDADEKGVEAAAATAIGMATGGGPSPLRQITLRLDRPFLFLVRDVETGAILFMGRVVDPSQK